MDTIKLFIKEAKAAGLSDVVILDTLIKEGAPIGQWLRQGLGKVKNKFWSNPNSKLHRSRNSIEEALWNHNVTNSPLRGGGTRPTLQLVDKSHPISNSSNIIASTARVVEPTVQRQVVGKVINDQKRKLLSGRDQLMLGGGAVLGGTGVNMMTQPTQSTQLHPWHYGAQSWGNHIEGAPWQGMPQQSAPQQEQSVKQLLQQFLGRMA